MANRIIYKSPDTGILIVVIPAYDDPSRPTGESDGDFLSRFIATGVPQGVTHRVVDDSTLPRDRYFRNQWEYDGRRVVVNMDAARVHHMDIIRRSRDAELAQLDVSFLRSVERLDLAAQERIAERKQALRDIPQKFDLSGATSPEALQQCWPEGLLRTDVG